MTQQTQRRVGAVAWLAARSLGARLIAGLLVLLALACATVGLVTYTHLHAVLINQVNGELQTASQWYTECLQPPPGGPDSRPDGDRSGNPPAQCSQQQA